MPNHSNTNMCSSFDVVEQTITSNGRYINDTNTDIINVEIPNSSTELTIDEIGVYKPKDYGVDYFDSVNVDIHPIDDETIKEICK